MQISEEWLTFEKDVLKQRPLFTGTVEECRNAYQATSDSLAPQYPKPEEWEANDHWEETDGGTRLLVHTPRKAPANTKLPVAVFAHGGGHIAGGVGPTKSAFDDKMCRYVAQNVEIIVIQVDFRLGPEHPTPAQCHSNASIFNGDPDRFISFGSSLGGGVAFAVALKLHDENLGAIVKGVVAMCPAAMHPLNVPEEYRSIYKAYEETWTGAPMQDGESMVVFYDHNGGSVQKANPYVFPCLHPGLRNLPRTYISVCGLDPVRDDGTVIKHNLDKFK
ncbi:MAG: hypothetical protein Q9221_007988 [Calogaya cf. arnoldii]